MMIAFIHCYSLHTNAFFYIIGSLLPPLSLSPDPPSVLQPPTNISVPLNRSAQFRCIPDGNPDPQISWQFQGVPIAGANGPIYSIAMVTGANGGQYTCVTSNAVGRTSATATLTVLCKCLNYWPYDINYVAPFSGLCHLLCYEIQRRKAKSQQVDSPPNCLEKLRNSLDLEVFQNLITKIITVARCFETQEPYPPPTYSLGLYTLSSTVVLSHVDRSARYM